MRQVTSIQEARAMPRKGTYTYSVGRKIDEWGQPTQTFYVSRDNHILLELVFTKYTWDDAFYANTVQLPVFTKAQEEAFRLLRDIRRAVAAVQREDGAFSTVEEGGGYTNVQFERAWGQAF